MKKFLLLLLCAGCGAVLAAEDDITFHGTLMSPPACSISGGQTIEVQISLSTALTAIMVVRKWTTN